MKTILIINMKEDIQLNSLVNERKELKEKLKNNLLVESEKDRLNIVNVQYNYLRKKTLDLGNDIIRELEENLKMFEIRIK